MMAIARAGLVCVSFFFLLSLECCYLYFFMISLTILIGCYEPSLSKPRGKILFGKS